MGAMRHLLLLPAVLALLSPVACSRGPELVQPPPPAEPPAEARALLEAAGLARFASDSPLEIQQGEPSPYPGYTVRPLSFELLPGFRSSAAQTSVSARRLLVRPLSPTKAAFTSAMAATEAAMREGLC